MSVNLGNTKYIILDSQRIERDFTFFYDRALHFAKQVQAQTGKAFIIRIDEVTGKIISEEEL